MTTITKLTAIGSLLLVLIGCSNDVERLASADTIYKNAKIYTADASRSMAQAIAVKNEEIIFVGSDKDANQYIGHNTKVINVDEKLILPGLHDVHIHPLGIVQLDTCDLESKAYSLDELVPVLTACIARYKIASGDWLIVEQWAFTQGNQPSTHYPTIRSALDAVSTRHPIFLKGNDGHHAAVNSAALATAKNASGSIVGINRETLERDFTDYRELIGRDENGQPDGSLNETARLLVDINPSMLLGDLIPPSAMPRVAQKLASYGITSVQDAAALLPSLALYESLFAAGEQTFRLTAALYPNFADYTAADGAIDINAILSDFKAVRDHYESNPLIKADAAKIFIDGVIEGNPLVVPATLPNAAQLEHYLQPLFDFDPATQSLDIRGYVDQDSAACQTVRASALSQTDSQLFRAQHGHLPSQCFYSNGVLEHPERFVHAYIKALDEHDYTVHAHAIGDRAVRTAIDAFSGIENHASAVQKPHNIGHAQMVNADDIKRAGELGLFVTMTYAWVKPEVAYDVTVTPFIDRVEAMADLYNPEHKAVKYSYPAKSLQLAGAVLAAGSDAPVDSREPRPFVNMQQALTRAGENGVIWNDQERLDIFSIIDAYTINGAKALRQSHITGSLEVGKKADFVIVDQNIIQLAQTHQAGSIDQTKVVMTVFNGKVVYEAL